MKKVAIFGLGLAIAASALIATPARAAFMPVIDEFWVVCPTCAAAAPEIFRDSFNDGALPPSGPDGPSTYFGGGLAGMTSETVGAPAVGKLTMTPSLGTATLISSTAASTFTGAGRILTTNPTNPNFLGVSDAFEIHGLFDLAELPSISGQSFGIRATDRATGLGFEGIDVFSVLVGVSGVSGDIGVFSRNNDFVAGTSDVVGFRSIQSFIDAVAATQIELIISKDAGSDLVDGSFRLLNGGVAIDCGGVGVSLCSLHVPGDASTPAPEVQIYTNADITEPGDRFTRPRFFSTDTIAVPEPASLALLGFGLVGLGLARRRKAV